MKTHFFAVLFGSTFAGLALLTLLDAALKGVVIFVLATLLALALAGASAAARHVVWLSALACALVVPCCAYLLPQWRVLPSWMSWEELPNSLNALPSARVAFETRPALPLPVLDEPPLLQQVPAPELLAPSWPILPVSRGIRINALTVLFGWLSGASLLLGSLFYSAASLGKISRNARVITDGSLAATLREMQQEVGVRGRVRLLLGSPGAMPMVWGILRPRLLLPAEAIGWSPSRLRGVLLHELAHVRRRDPLSMRVAQLALALHWFNPLAWLAVRHLRAEQERACDDAVLRHGIRASDYASDLIAIATSQRVLPFGTAALTMAHPARLEGRIIGILDAARNRRALTRWLVLSAALMAILVALPLAMLRAADQGSAEKQAAPSASTVPNEPSPEVARGRGRILDRKGIVLAENTVTGLRRYPFAALMSHALGYTTGQWPARPMEGRAGCERLFDSDLSEGRDIKLTLDAALQSHVGKVLREAGIGRGSVVILDPATGDLLADASVPNFDPSDFSPKISTENWEILSKSPYALTHRSLHACPPGSLYKLVVAAAAGRTGKADRTYLCSGSVDYGGKTFKCWAPEGHGKLDLSQALAASCHCYFFQLGNDIGIDALKETAHQLGLGELSGLGLHEENAGRVPSPEFLEKLRPGAQWSPGHTANTANTANTAIGQGWTLATPLQMTGLAATIANGGRVLAPRLRDDGLPRLRVDLVEKDYPPQHLALLRAAMRGSVASGTGIKANSALVAIAGQAATIEFSHSEAGINRTETRGWFIGYAPAEAPRYAFAILVEAGTGGGTAAPIARRLMETLVTGLPSAEPQARNEGHMRPVEKAAAPGE